MSSRPALLGRLKDKQDVILNAICLLFAMAFLLLALSNLRWAGDFMTVDSLFVMTVFGLLALVFLVNPVLWAHERGLFEQWFGVGDDAEAPAAHGPAEEIHFAGSTKLFLAVLGGLLLLTLVEVVLAYFHVPLAIMLSILVGLSLIKAAMIMAWFMHLKYERMSLVFSLVPALVICICLLFIFFPDSFRNRGLRPAEVRQVESPHSN
jgi:cytochrome c oxidase subunit 4